VTIHNDGQVAADVAALATTVFGASAQSDLALQSRGPAPEISYREIARRAWTPVGAHGWLLDGALHGRRHQHYTLQPGDTATIEQLIVVPRKYDVLLLQLQMVFERYPINPRIDVQLQNKNGVITLNGHGKSVVSESYFSV
jgi:hypothetical protein